MGCLFTCFAILLLLSLIVHIANTQNHTHQTNFAENCLFFASIKRIDPAQSVTNSVGNRESLQQLQALLVPCGIMKVFSVRVS